MGIHYVNFDLLATPPDPLEPAILLYVPRGDGFRLVGVEYFAASIGTSESEGYTGPWFRDEESLPDDWVWLPAPVLFGQTMGGPMPGHGAGMPWHYDLHVWLWEENPSGMFAEFNPNLSCD